MGLGNIPSSLVPHMHTPSALLGHSIGQMANSQVIHTTKLHKILNLHLQLYKWGVLLYPSLEVNPQWEANL
jgi:hypothetical protein